MRSVLPIDFPRIERENHRSSATGASCPRERAEPTSASRRYNFDLLSARRADAGVLKGDRVMSDTLPAGLPARPSLEQLQKQAKELLRQYRRGDAAAIERFRAAKPHNDDVKSPEAVTLADAQFVLAREYGFETWAKLKHHVRALQPTGVQHYEQLARE